MTSRALFWNWWKITSHPEQQSATRTSPGGIATWNACCDESKAATTRQRKLATLPPEQRVKQPRGRCKRHLTRRDWTTPTKTSLTDWRTTTTSPLGFVKSCLQDNVGVAPPKDEGTLHMDSIFCSSVCSHRRKTHHCRTLLANHVPPSAHWS